MPQSLSQVYLHLVWSTKERLPWIGHEVEFGLHQYIRGICENQGSHLLCINGMPDHIHLLVTLPRTLTIAEMIGGIKAASSKWIKVQYQSCHSFAWQSGYGVFSVSMARVERCKDYINNQKNHHAGHSGQPITFQEELISLLDAYGIRYNLRYLWD